MSKLSHERHQSLLDKLPVYDINDNESKLSRERAVTYFEQRIRNSFKVYFSKAKSSTLIECSHNNSATSNQFKDIFLTI